MRILITDMFIQVLVDSDLEKFTLNGIGFHDSDRTALVTFTPENGRVSHMKIPFEIKQDPLFSIKGEGNRQRGTDEARLRDSLKEVQDFEELTKQGHSLDYIAALVIERLKLALDPSRDRITR